MEKLENNLSTKKDDKQENLDKIAENQENKSTKNNLAKNENACVNNKVKKDSKKANNSSENNAKSKLKNTNDSAEHNLKSELRNANNYADNNVKSESKNANNIATKQKKGGIEITTEKQHSEEKASSSQIDSTKQLKKYKDKSKNKRKKIIITVALIFILLVVLTLSTIFGIITASSNKIISGVSINGIDISNLTKDEAIIKLNTELGDNLNREITLIHNEYSTKINTTSIESHYNIEQSVNEAFSIGRSENNIFSNNIQVIKTYLSKNNITPSISYNENLLDEKINSINEELPDRVVNSSYKIENNKLIIANSTNGYRIQNETLKNNIYTALANNENSIEIPVEEYHADKVDIDAIYKEIHKDPVDATFNTNPYELKKEEDGLDFAISLDEAKAMVMQPQESYTIPLKVLKPKVTVKTLPQEAFPDQLATYSTTYSSSNYNRSTNISLAARAVNGYVLMPGETFSYNSALGQRTTAKGYKEAGAYSNGEVTTAVGGGICQVSSTLYNAVLLCNLEIVDRRNHTFEPSYVPAGQDATVSWQTPDFKFKNNREYPIRISATAGSGRITFVVYGVKSDNDYEVKIQSSKIGSIPFTTQYVDNPNMPAGTTKVTQAGSNGCKSQTYKILYKNGKEVSRTLINSDTYKPHNQVIERGTKVVQTNPTPQTPQTPSQPETPSTPDTQPASPTQTPANSADNSSVTITTVPAE